MKPNTKELKLLIVEDNLVDRIEYARKLKKDFPLNYSLLESETGQQGIKRCIKEAPDCILLDYMLPDMNGLEFLSILNKIGFLGPVIMLTGQDDESVALDAMKRGAHDYIVKGKLDSELLCDAIQNAVNSTQTNESKIWKNQTWIDSLTKVLNRDAYNLTMEQVIRDFKRFNEPTVVIVLEIDQLKEFNDLYGPRVGGSILQLVATSLSNSVQSSDLVFRYNGEKFVILLKKCSLDECENVGEIIRQDVDKVFFLHKSQKLHLTICLGITPLKESDTEEIVFQRAGQALNKAKKIEKKQFFALD
jgi:diguanylate cyclase (GGDEF)-like protein